MLPLAGWSFPQPKGQYRGCVKRRWHYSDGVWVKICRGVQIAIKKIIYMWKIVTLVPEIKLSPLDGISHNRMLWRKKKFWRMEIQAGWAGYREEHSHYGHFPGPWVENGKIYDPTSRLQLRWPLCCCGWHNRAPCWRSSRWSAERRAHLQATCVITPFPPKKCLFSIWLTMTPAMPMPTYPMM